MRYRNTIEYLGIWEQLYNPNFKPIEFEGFRMQAGLNAFSLSPKKWIVISFAAHSRLHRYILGFSRNNTYHH